MVGDSVSVKGKCGGSAPGYGRCTCCKRVGGRLQVTLVFSVGEVLYDIANMAWVEGDVMDGTEYNHVRHLVQDIAEDGNRDRVMRVMKLAHAEAGELLYPWSREEVAVSTQLDNVPTDEDVLVTRLSVPARTSMNTINLILRLIHEWMVCRVLEDWLGVTYAGGAPLWTARLEAIRGQIRDAKRRNDWVTRRKLWRL